MSQYMRAKDISNELNICESNAYKIIHELNQELKEKGYRTVNGRCPRSYFEERYYLQQKKDV